MNQEVNAATFQIADQQKKSLLQQQLLTTLEAGIIYSSYSPTGTNLATACQLPNNICNDAMDHTNGTCFILPKISDGSGTVYIYNESGSVLKIYSSSGEFVCPVLFSSGTSYVNLPIGAVYRFTCFSPYAYWLVEAIQSTVLGNINIPINGYIYFATSTTLDTINDIRLSTSGGTLVTQKCTLGNAVKGGGTWV